MKPNLKQIYQYRDYLIRQDLIDTVQNFLLNPKDPEVDYSSLGNVTQIKFENDYDSDDQGGSSFTLYKIKVKFENGDSFDFGWDYERLMDACYNVSELLNTSDYECNYTINVADHKEPFSLELTEL